MYAAKRPRPRLRAPAAIIIAAAALAASACILDRSPGSVEIPPEVTTSNEQYTLLYSTLGYDSAGAKHVLIRQNDIEVAPAQGLAFHWRLADEDGHERASGLAQYGGTAWGIPLWVADFTDVDRPGDYRLLVESTGIALATPAFRIDDYLLSRATLESVALDNAEQRAAPVEFDSGYYEGNSVEGSAGAHAQFLLGLIDVFDQRRFVLTGDQRGRLQSAINRAVDYVLLLTDPATGEIANTSDRRGLGDDFYDTPEGLRALARYAVVFQREDAARAQRAYRLARLAEGWVRDNASGEYTPPLRAAVSYDLFLYSNDAAALESTFAAAREIAENYDIRESARHGADATAWFETLSRLALDFPDHPDRPLWLDAAQRNAALYAQMLDATPFGVVPPAPALDDGPTPAEQWDATAREFPVTDGQEGAMANDWFLARALDAIYLARMTDDDRLYGVAAASLSWITGVNPGIDSEYVPAPRSGSSFEAASFLLAQPGRTALGWEEWSFQRRQPAGTILAGFLENFAYDDGFVSGETSIARDGLWLRAVILFEDTLHAAGAAAPQPDAAARPQSELTVELEIDPDPGAPVLIPHVTDRDGQVVSGATVSVAWSAPLAAGLPADQASSVMSCVTTPEGSCTIALDVEDVGWTGSITAAVTNVSHPRLRFEPSDALPEPVVFN